MTSSAAGVRLPPLNAEAGRRRWGRGGQGVVVTLRLRAAVGPGLLASRVLSGSLRGRADPLDHRGSRKLGAQPDVGGRALAQFTEAAERLNAPEGTQPYEGEGIDAFPAQQRTPVDGLLHSAEVVDQRGLGRGAQSHAEDASEDGLHLTSQAVDPGGVEACCSRHDREDQ